MRIIAGKFRGRKLKSPPSLQTRPTSDRLRETLFNILAPRIEGNRFLDLCAGSGAVGIEALSRGASAVVFIERSRPACATIKQNLTSLGVDRDVRIINQDVEAALAQLENEAKRFDIVFFDPPYASEIYDRVMNGLGTGSLLSN